MKLKWTSTGLFLCLSACTTTKEIEPTLAMPTASDIEAIERAEWDSRLAYLRRSKVIDQTAIDVKLVRIFNLDCWPMFNKWAECNYEMEVASDGEFLPSQEIFGQFDPQSDGQWKSAIIMWHMRRK